MGVVTVAAVGRVGYEKREQPSGGGKEDAVGGDEGGG